MIDFIMNVFINSEHLLPLINIWSVMHRVDLAFFNCGRIWRNSSNFWSFDQVEQTKQYPICSFLFRQKKQPCSTIWSNLTTWSFHDRVEFDPTLENSAFTWHTCRSDRQPVPESGLHSRWIASPNSILSSNSMHGQARGAVPDLQPVPRAGVQPIALRGTRLPYSGARDSEGYISFG